MEPDKFNGVTNEEFIAYFKIDLHSRMEIINYTYPHELLDEDGGFGEHVQRCVGLLKDYITLCFRETRAAARKQLNQSATIDSSTDAEMNRLQSEMSQETPEDKKKRLEIEMNEEKEEVENKYKELRDDINTLIDEHHEKVKIIYFDL